MNDVWDVMLCAVHVLKWVISDGYVSLHWNKARARRALIRAHSPTMECVLFHSIKLVHNIEVRLVTKIVGVIVVTPSE